jgi:SAM-dependent methyltransferase
METNAAPLPGSGPVGNAGSLYDVDFYRATAGRSKDSARVILGLLFEIFQPDSVFDLGCGQGAWLAAAEQLGSKYLVGFDGSWVDPTSMQSSRCTFKAANFEEDIELPGRFDLAVSVEVAEHVSSARARAFVETLCRASDVVVFSAAIRHQGGVRHLNEQWQSFWAALFNEMGYECCDFFRPRIWTDSSVETWYRQNVLLYVNRSHPILEDAKAKSLKSGPLDIVHPEMFEGNLETYKRPVEEPTFKFCCRMFAKWGRRQLRKLTR